MQINEILASLTALITAIIMAWKTVREEKRKDKKYVPKKVLEQTDVNVDISNRMNSLLDKLKADRVQFFEFHNGEHYANGSSALKLSCSFEIVREGVEHYQELLQGILIQTIGDFLQVLFKDRVIERTDMNEVKAEFPTYYQLKELQGVKSFYARVVRNSKRQPVGYLIVQFTEKAHTPMNQEQIDDINSLKYYIENILNKLKR